MRVITPSTALLTAAALAMGFASAPAADSLAMRVSQSVAQPIEATAKAFATSHAGFEYSVVGCGTAASVMAVGSGDAVLGATVQLLNEDEKKAYPELVLKPYCYDAVVLVVNAENPIANLTTAQVQGICTGKIANWKELGGKDEAVVGISRAKANAIVVFFEAKFGLEHRIEGTGKNQTMTFQAKGSHEPGTAKMPITGAHQDALVQVVANPGGFTYVPLGQAAVMQAKGLVKIVSLDGVAVTEANIRNKSYPLSRTVYLATKGEPQGQLGEFVTMLLAPEGQKLAVQYGNVSLAP